MQRVLYLAALAAMAVALTGCDSLRDAAGMNKISPDEFAVVTKAPLVIPPDYNLKPPKPGAAPTNQISPTDTAEGTLYGQSKMASANGPISAGEQQLLAKAGAQNSSNMIRQRIAADNKAMQAADDSFTNRLLFGMGSDHSHGAPLDADAEKQRLDEGTVTTTAARPSQGQTTIQKDSGGWFDGLLDGVF